MARKGCCPVLLRSPPKCGPHAPPPCLRMDKPKPVPPPRTRSVRFVKALEMRVKVFCLEIPTVIAHRQRRQYYHGAERPFEYCPGRSDYLGVVKQVDEHWAMRSGSANTAGKSRLHSIVKPKPARSACSIMRSYGLTIRSQGFTRWISRAVLPASIRESSSNSLTRKVRLSTSVSMRSTKRPAASGHPAPHSRSVSLRAFRLAVGVRSSCAKYWK